MCGIIGIFGEKPSSERAKQSLEKIIHRGSSFFELSYFENAIIGANRLPIVDRENGIQPQTNEDKTISVVLNGEIFNYLELRNGLIEKGHRFKTLSDTEVLAHLFEEYGPKMVNMLESEMYALIIYDQKKNSVFVARDSIGVKPLYYGYDKDERLYFASEMKQLSFFDDIKKIYDFPPGSYFHDGKFVKYFTLKIKKQINNEKQILSLLEKRLLNAVKARVATDLPIGVFLSGGIDSSLIMEIASRFHPDVTALILGYPDSPDYKFALRLCQERKYKYHVIHPNIDYEKELEDLIYSLETYEPLIIRQSFASHLCSQAAKRLGLKIILSGEGADELFAGYNEFSNFPEKSINQGCLLLIDALKNGHLQRVDRMSMRHTVEVRSPYLDQEVINLAMQINGKLKIKKVNHQVITKYILRKLASNFLPEYIAWRYKMPFSNGAGMNVGSNYKAEDGEVAKIAFKKLNSTVDAQLIKKYNLTTKESQYYFQKFQDFGFSKLKNSEKRLVVKDNLNDIYKSKKTSLLVAEFDRLALYFPVYFAAEQNIFDLHNLDVDFIATNGDDRTYHSLVNNSAHIGLADPLFAMIENKEGVKGEIIGSLVDKIPAVAVTINPHITINSLNDFANYKIGTFQKFSTTHSVAKYLLPENTQFMTFHHHELALKLIDRTIDIAIVLLEQALNIVAEGGRIVFDFQPQMSQFLFTGFSVANTLEPRYKKSLKAFMVAVRESIRQIHSNPDIAFQAFVKLFPDLKESQKTFESYLKIWTKNTAINKEGYRNSYKVWQKNYPHLLKEYSPYFYSFSKADEVIKKINSAQYRREFPFLEEGLEQRILQALNGNKPLHFIGFWGASNKSQVDEKDLQAIQFFKKYIKSIADVFKPGIKVTWILADEHAKNNNYYLKDITSYLAGVKNLLDSSFETIFLSTLWKKWSMSHEKISQSLTKKYLHTLDENALLFQKIRHQAEKRFYGIDKKLGAEKYYLMRLLEKKYLEQEYKDSVFFCFSNSDLQPIYPSLPTLYLYALGSGKSEAPWFSQ